MQRVAHLITVAHDVQRRIWASLPLGVRVAQLFMRLAVSSAEAFGRGCYGEFAKHGITGIPDDPKHAATEFGGLVYKTLLAKFRNPTLAEDVMSSYMKRFLEGQSRHLQAGASLSFAQSYVLKGVINEALNHLKALNRRRENSLVRDDDGDDVTVDLHDTRAVPNMEREMIRKEFHKKLPQIRHKLEAVHPSAPQYIDLMLTRGLDDKEIVGSPKDGIPSMLDHPYNNSGAALTPASWDATYKPKILAVLKTVFT